MTGVELQERVLGLPRDLRIYLRGFVCSYWVAEYERCANCFVDDSFLRKPLIWRGEPSLYFCSGYCCLRYSDFPVDNDEDLLFARRNYYQLC